MVYKKNMKKIKLDSLNKKINFLLTQTEQLALATVAHPKEKALLYCGFLFVCLFKFWPG